MLEKFKSFLNKLIVSEPETKFEAKSLEVNPPENRLVNRKEARLGRLLTIKNPSQEVKDEIKSLKEVLKGK